MQSVRPYQAGRTASAAMVELRRCAGTQFDASVVDAFCDVLADELPSAARPLEALPG